MTIWSLNISWSHFDILSFPSHHTDIRKVRKCINISVCFYIQVHLSSNNRAAVSPSLCPSLMYCLCRRISQEDFLFRRVHRSWKPVFGVPRFWYLSQTGLVNFRYPQAVTKSKNQNYFPGCLSKVKFYKTEILLEVVLTSLMRLCNNDPLDWLLTGK